MIQMRGGVNSKWVTCFVTGLVFVLPSFYEETDQPFEIDDYWQLDLQYSYIFDSLKGGQLRLGCRNCLDEDPPVYNQTVDAEPFHEGRGAMVYVRWSQPF